MGEKVSCIFIDLYKNILEKEIYSYEKRRIING